MVDLIARSPAGGHPPVEHGTVRLEEIELGSVTSVMPFRGGEEAVSRALGTAFGLRFPQPGETCVSDDGRIVWSGQGQALLIGPPMPAIVEAALTDQSDAWAALRLSGGDVDAVLARLTPLDLRDATFGPGRSARSLLNHMNACLVRNADRSVDILIFRSMALTAIEEIGRAMRQVAATR